MQCSSGTLFLWTLIYVDYIPINNGAQCYLTSTSLSSHLGTYLEIEMQH